jgi:hypothetical protein
MSANGNGRIPPYTIPHHSGKGVVNITRPPKGNFGERAETYTPPPKNTIIATGIGKK